MRYLYGDSTESPIEIDYLSFVRGGVDFAAEVLRIGEHIAEKLDRREHIAGTTELEVKALKALGATAKAAVAAKAEGVRASSIRACAEALGEAGDRVVERFVQAAEAGLRDELARIDADVTRRRREAGAALDKLLLAHPIPGTRARLQVSIAAPGTYQARLSQSSDLGLIWTTELEIPSDHLLASPLRVDRALEMLALPNKLMLRTPGEGGVFRKRVKWVPQRLAKEYVAELSRGDQRTTLKLREGPDLDQPGLDIELNNRAARVSVKQVGRETVAEEFEPEPEDAEPLAAFARALATSAESLRDRQRAVVDARFDGALFSTYEAPVDLVRRLLGFMAPVVREIARRSPGEEELVLKRLVGDDRREEVFVSFDELRQRLEALPAALRREFSMFPFFRDGASGDDEVTVERPTSSPALASVREGASKGKT